MSYSDAELIKRTLDGDETAFGFLVDKYKGAVHALAYRKVGDFHIAEEITQDTFLKAYQKLRTLKEPKHFSGWLYVIAARCCISFNRKKRLRFQSIDSVSKNLFDSLAWSKHADARVREEVGYTGTIMPDHWPGVVGDSPLIGHAHALGYLKALMDALCVYEGK